jgi:PadR family transcriptional regulator PadR
MGRESKMADAKTAETRLSHTAAMILQALDAGFVYGFSIMEMTGLPSGTVYPAMRRLERDQLIRSNWERQSIADAEQRPPRKYYKLTAAGRTTLESSRKRYPLLDRLIPTAAEARTV